MIRPLLGNSRRRLWRFALLLLVIIPALPEIVIVMTAAVAEILGWDQKGVCTFRSAPLANIITFSLQAAAGFILAGVRADVIWLNVFYTAVAAWLCLSLTTVSLGWTSTLGRLSLGLAVAFIFAFLPYFGPALAIANLTNDHCRPNEAGVGDCVMFGGYVSGAHDALALGWLAGYGIPLAFGVFAIYAIAVIGFGANSRKRARAVMR